MEKNIRYVHGSAAPAYTNSPARKIEREQERRPRTKRKQKKRVDKVSLIVVGISLTISFLVCFQYLRAQFEATYLSKNLISLENQVIELEKQNMTLSEQIDESIDLSKVYTKATKELGMVQAKNNQVFTYLSHKGNQVKQYGDIPVN